MVMLFKRQGKRQLLYAHSSPSTVDILPTSPPNYYTSHESTYEMEKETLKEASEERKDAKQEDENSLVTPQDQSCDETGM